MTQGIDRIPDALGHLVLNEDGAVISSGGELQNEEKLADRLMRLVQNVVKISVAGEKPSNLKRVSVIWESFMYAITISNHKVFVIKRPYVPQEPVKA